MTHTLRRNPIPMAKKEHGRSDHEKLDMQGQIRQRAYELYEQRGRRDGHQVEDWIQAEQEVRDKYGLSSAA